MSIVFNGRKIVHPGAYDETRSGDLVTVYTQGQRIPVLIGQADTGECGVLKWFDNPNAAKKYVTGGDLFDCIDLAFSPTPEGGGGCSRIGIIVANATKPSKLVSGAITVNSIIHGEGANKISFQLSEGSIQGSKRVLIERWDTGVVEVIDNIGAIAEVRYTGSKKYASVTISGSGIAKKLVLKSGDAKESQVTDIDLDLSPDRFKTVGDLVNYINSISGYSVSIPEIKSAKIPVTGLNAVSETQITAEKGLLLTGVAADLPNRINSQSELVRVEVNAQSYANANVFKQYLTGGARGEAPKSWSAYFDILKKNYCKVMVLLTDSIAIQSEAVVFMGQMENRGIKMSMFTGGGIGETIEQCKKRASILNSSRAYVAYPEGYAMIKQGQSKLVPPYVVSAMLAGRKCGVPASEPITFDYFNLIELGVDLMAGDTEVDELIEAGVCVLERVQNNGIRLAQGVSTYIGDVNEDILYKEMSVRMGADDLSDRITNKLEKMFVGNKKVGASVGIESSMQVATIDELEQAKRDGDILDYSPDVVVTRKGTAYYVSYSASISVPTNFILITSNFITE